MEYLEFVVSFLLLFPILVRLSRWLAIAQQKEYRFDRLKLFLQTAEGVKELFRLTSPVDWSKTGFKRPRSTLRVLVTAVCTMFLLGSLLIFKISLIAFCVAVLVLIPAVVVGCAVVPTFVFELYTGWLLRKAAAMLAHHSPYIIGITGSYGKTATKLLLVHVLSQKWTVFAPPRSYNTIYSISKSVIHSYKGQKFAVIEYAAYRMGEIARLARRLVPHDAIITGLTEQHVGLFGSLENIIKAKTELITAVPIGGTVYYANEAAKKITLPGSTNGKTVVFTDSESLTGSLTQTGKLEIINNGKKISTQLVGMQYIDTVKTVWRVAQDLGMTASECAAALTSFVPPSGFTQSYQLNTGTTVIDDGGTSNPAGFVAALALADQLEGKRKILVTSGIVDLGGRSTEIHLQLAQRAAAACHEVWYVGQTGIVEFMGVFGSKLFHGQGVITEKLTQLSTTDLILLEGRMPGWFLNTFKKYVTNL